MSKPAPKFATEPNEFQVVKSPTEARASSEKKPTSAVDVSPRELLLESTITSPAKEPESKLLNEIVAAFALATAKIKLNANLVFIIRGWVRLFLLIFKLEIHSCR
jgi:hypothetical protein